MGSQIISNGEAQPRHRRLRGIGPYKHPCAFTLKIEYSILPRFIPCVRRDFSRVKYRPPFESPARVFQPRPSVCSRQTSHLYSSSNKLFSASGRNRSAQSGVSALRTLGGMGCGCHRPRRRRRLCPACNPRRARPPKRTAFHPRIGAAAIRRIFLRGHRPGPRALHHSRFARHPI